MAKTLKGGHRVRFEDDERLDIPDTQDLPELVYDYLNAVSSFLGAGTETQLDGGLPVGGTLTTLVFDTSTPSATTIYGPGGTASDKAVFSASYKIGNGEFEHHLLEYDPSASGQQTTVDLGPSAYSDGDTPFIWARRVDVNTDVDTRRKWNTVSGAEELFSLATREGYRIEFETTPNTTSPDSSDPRWVCIAQVTSISGSGTVFDIDLVHPFDLGTRPDSSSYYRWGPLIKSTAPTFNYMGVAQGFWQLRSLLATETALREASDATQDTAIAQNASDIAVNALAISTVDENVDKLVNQMHAVRIKASGTGTWSIVSDVGPPGQPAAAINGTAFSGWRVDVSFGFTFSSVHLSTAVDPATGPEDVLAQFEKDIGAPTANTGITIYVQTLQNLFAVSGYDWTTPPSGSPPANVVIDILAIK